MLPHMGQGADQAIEDAMALATLLRETFAADVPDVLVHFQQLRRDRTARIQECPGRTASRSMPGPQSDSSGHGFRVTTSKPTRSLFVAT